MILLGHGISYSALYYTGNPYNNNNRESGNIDGKVTTFSTKKYTEKETAHDKAKKIVIRNRI